MILTKKMTAAVLLALTINLHGEFGAWVDTEHHEGVSLHIAAGKYRIRFAEQTSWTFREAFYGSKVLFASTGVHQPVLNEAGTPREKGGAEAFLGTGHRREKIELIELIVTGNDGMSTAYPVQNGLRITDGREFTVHKQSRFISEYNGLFYDHIAKVTISPDGIREEYHFKVTGNDLSAVRYMFVFMHIFPRTATFWLAGDDEKEIERGEARGENTFSLSRDIRFALVFDPVQNLGVAMAYPEMYRGILSKNMFWHRAGDNKFYFQIDPEREHGKEFSFSMKTRAFDAGKENWTTKGADQIGKLIGNPIVITQ